MRDEPDEAPTCVNRRVEDLVHLVRGRAARTDDEEIVPERESELAVQKAGRELIARDADAVVAAAGRVFAHQADGLEVVRPDEASVIDRERQKDVETPVQRHRLARARDEHLEVVQRLDLIDLHGRIRRWYEQERQRERDENDQLPHGSSPFPPVVDRPGLPRRHPA